MTKTNDTVNRVKQYPDIGTNCFIKPEDQDAAVMILRLVAEAPQLLSMLSELQTANEDDSFIAYRNNIEELAIAANQVLTPINKATEYQCSFTFYDPILGRQAH